MNIAECLSHATNQVPVKLHEFVVPGPCGCWVGGQPLNRVRAGTPPASAPSPTPSLEDDAISCIYFGPAAPQQLSGHILTLNWNVPKAPLGELH